MKLGDTVKFKLPLNEAEDVERMKLIENPDGGRVLVESICKLSIRPTRVLNVSDLERVS